MEAWQPLSRRNEGSPITEEAPYEGVPAHLKPYLLDWLEYVLQTEDVPLSAIALPLRLPVAGLGVTDLLETMEDDDILLLDAVDLTLALYEQVLEKYGEEVEGDEEEVEEWPIQDASGFHDIQVGKLERLLRLAGSAWGSQPTADHWSGA